MTESAATQPRSARQLIHSVLLSKGRMEALTDGIFAIAMTLLVLELKVPDIPKSVSNHELMARLGEEGPAFFSFFISFMYCGVLWFLHHLAMHFVRHLQAAIVWLNLLFLMSISVLPFSCALLGHLIRNSAAQQIYFGNMLAAALLLWMQWLLAKKRKLVNEDDPRATRAMGQRLAIFPAAVTAGVVAAAYRPMAGFYAMAAVLLAMRVWQRKSFRKELQA
jgi:uncharacterized membrane protein